MHERGAYSSISPQLQSRVADINDPGRNRLLPVSLIADIGGLPLQNANSNASPHTPLQSPVRVECAHDIV